MTAIRDGLRRLRHQPGFAVVTAITMALGVAAATVLFSLVYGVLLKPLPWPDAARLVKVSESRIGATRQFPGALTNGTYLAWSEHPATLGAIGAWSQDDATLTANPGAPERVHVMNVTPSLLGLLHARPFMGSLFAPGDERPGRPPVVLLWYALWQRRFSGDPLVIGRPVRLDGDACTVLGVMPEDFAFPDRDAQAWRPFYVPPVVGENPDQRHLSLFQALGRLRADVTPAQAAAEGTARAAEAPDLNLVGVAVFGANGPAVVSAVPLLDAMTAGVRQPLLLFLAAVGLLVATATANIASLQLARATSRRRETAIRAALGASGGKLAAPVLIESALVGLCGGLAGLGLAVGLVRLLPALLPAGFPRLDAVAVDGTVAAFAVAVSLLSALVFGLAPVLLSRRANLVESLAEDGLAPSGGGARTAAARARRLIIVGQVAIATVLLVGGLLLARSFAALLAADRGYQPASVLTAELPLPDETSDGLRRSALLDRTLDRLRALPGVQAAAAGTGSPLMTFAGPFRQGVMLKAFTMPSVTGEGPVSVQASVRLVSAGWFRALGTRLVEGRAFGATDTRTSAPVVVVNRAFARRYLADRAVDRTLPIGADGAPDVRVVGVVEDIHQGSITDPVQPEIYLPVPAASGRLLAAASQHRPARRRQPVAIRRGTAAPDPLGRRRSGPRFDDDSPGSLERQPGRTAPVRAAARRVRGVGSPRGRRGAVRGAVLRRGAAGTRNRRPVGPRCPPDGHRPARRVAGCGHDGCRDRRRHAGGRRPGAGARDPVVRSGTCRASPRSWSWRPCCCSWPPWPRRARPAGRLAWTPSRCFASDDRVSGRTPRPRNLRTSVRPSRQLLLLTATFGAGVVAWWRVPGAPEVVAAARTGPAPPPGAAPSR